MQPRIEGAILLAMIGAAATGFLPVLAPVHGLLLILAGILALLRLARWRLWLCSSRVDLVCLGVGYLWLGAGLILLGAARGYDLSLAPAVATHAIVVGALGTLTTCIMLRTRLLRLRVDPHRANHTFVGMTCLISLAALGRILGAGVETSMLLAAVAWCLALLLLLGQFFRLAAGDEGQNLQ